MKYMLLIYSPKVRISEEQRAACIAKSTQLCHELSAQGRFLAPHRCIRWRRRPASASAMATA